MIVTLDVREEAKLVALAQARGVSTATLLRVALEPILATATEDCATPKVPPRSLPGLLAKYGSGPSSEGIDENRLDMLADCPRS